MVIDKLQYIIVWCNRLWFIPPSPPLNAVYKKAIRMLLHNSDYINTIIGTIYIIQMTAENNFYSQGYLSNFVSYFILSFAEIVTRIIFYVSSYTTNVLWSSWRLIVHLIMVCRSHRLNYDKTTIKTLHNLIIINTLYTS